MMGPEALPHMEFAYNMENLSTKKAPFEVVYTRKPRHSHDLVSAFAQTSWFQSTSKNLAEKVQQIQAEVKQNLEKANEKYKADKHRMVKTFEVGV